MEWVLAAITLIAIIVGFWFWRGRWLLTTWVEMRIEDDER